MCGIVGYIGGRQAMPILMDGLSHLEYRGYDSAGIAVLAQGELGVRKSMGKLKNLAALLKERPLGGVTGIGHTRWATHGEPSDLNAHPHTDVKGGIAVVHNGIIENHAALRGHLESQGCRFVSQTDTEVIAHLLHTLYHGDMREALLQAMSYLEGSYAVGVICRDEPDALYCMRKDSPLVVGMGRGEQFLASDIPALLSHTRDMVLLEDKEIAVLTREGVEIYDQYGRMRAPALFHVNWDAAAAEKGGYEHFMLKEIYEQPRALRDTCASHTREGAVCNIPIAAREAQTVDGLTVIACGTAYHAGLAGKQFIETLCGLPVRVEIASEYRYSPPLSEQGAAVLAISQSGETADTLAALREAKKRGARAYSLTNAVGSTLARETGDNTMFTFAGPEIAVASTKAYVTQVEMMLLIALDLAQKRGTLEKARAGALLASLCALPELAERCLADTTAIQRFAAKHFDRRHIFFIGRGIDYALALEGALKLKEISYIVSEAYAAGELKHGAIALIEQGTPVVALCTQERLLEKTLSNLREVKARGAETLIVCTEALAGRAREVGDTLLTVPDAGELLSPLLAILPMQLLAYHMAVARGCDVDKPRNLAKSVTVE